MSFQRHTQRNEIWLVSEGSCEVIYSKSDPNLKTKIILKKFDSFNVSRGEWHQITNPFDQECKIIEIQYGDSVIEDDIERLNYYDNKKS